MSLISAWGIEFAGATGRKRRVQNKALPKSRRQNIKNSKVKVI
jgi:hypothetical protein